MGNSAAAGKQSPVVRWHILATWCDAPIAKAVLTPSSTQPKAVLYDDALLAEYDRSTCPYAIPLRNPHTPCSCVHAFFVSHIIMDACVWLQSGDGHARSQHHLALDHRSFHGARFYGHQQGCNCHTWNSRHAP